MQRRCRKARNNWVEGKCKVETLFRIGKVNAAHRIMRENLSKRRIDANIVRDEDGKSLRGLKPNKEQSSYKT